MIKKSIYTLSLLLMAQLAFSQYGYWQQRADYKMDIDFNVETNQYKGQQTITYTNNSPDDLDKLFYHLYFNAFQPGSMMDVRSLNIKDPDRRVRDRISKLTPDQYGWQKVKSLKVDGRKQKFITEGTILEVTLDRPIKSGSTVKLEMEWDSQVPLQIRRTGRDNKEGVEYSMAQWYPKLSEYDYQGWHANPYIAREFHGIWGDWDVKITIDSDYIMGATGELENAAEIGYGYAPEPASRPEKLTWHWKAKNVHDFVWGADPDFVHEKLEAHNGTMLHALYQPGEKTTENWQLLLGIMDEALKYMNENYGEYTYSSYSFIQGGDGGMEYPMATLITGERSLGSLVGVSIHEWMHSWYHMMMATDEARYPWMDEGFTSYGSAYTTNYLKEKNKLPGDAVDYPVAGSIRGYANFAKSGLDEPISMHADHYDTNSAYSSGSYSKGSIFLAQLKYIIGEKAFKRGLLRYYDEWKGKHPTPDDFVRIMEKESGLELDWYKEYMVYTTKYPDYGIDTIIDKTVKLVKNGRMPMPIEVVVTTKKGDKEVYYIPLRMMRGEKPNEWPKDVDYNVAPDWPWTHPTYDLKIKCKAKNVAKIEINPSKEFIDLNRADNVYPKE